MVNENFLKMYLGELSLELIRYSNVWVVKVGQNSYTLSYEIKRSKPIIIRYANPDKGIDNYYVALYTMLGQKMVADMVHILGDNNCLDEDMLFHFVRQFDEVAWVLKTVMISDGATVTDGPVLADNPILTEIEMLLMEE